MNRRRVVEDEEQEEFDTGNSYKDKSSRSPWPSKAGLDSRVIENGDARIIMTKSHKHR